MPQEIIWHALNNENIRAKKYAALSRVVCSGVCLSVGRSVCLSVRLLVCLFECCLRCLTCFKHKCNAFSCQKLRLRLRYAAPGLGLGWLPASGHGAAHRVSQGTWEPVNKVDQTARPAARILRSASAANWKLKALRNMKWSSSRARGSSGSTMCPDVISNVASMQMPEGGVEAVGSALITPSPIKRLSSCAQCPYATSLPPFLSQLPDFRYNRRS